MKKINLKILTKLKKNIIIICIFLDYKRAKKVIFMYQYFVLKRTPG